MKGVHMSLEDFTELVDHINKNHSFSEVKGKRIKYITPIYDTRIGKIFCVNLRLTGEGKYFSLTNENKDKDLKQWIYDWLENGNWNDET